MLGYNNNNPLTVYGLVVKVNNQSETLWRPITLSGGTMTSSPAINFTDNGDLGLFRRFH